jgi:uncharacterized zinc-type alcohol dehydrogenase-like protein
VTVTSTVTAYAAAAAGEPLTRTTIERLDLGPHDVKIEIHYTGVCHSDIHQVHGDWGKGLFLMVPGHEIAGIVAETGSEVTTRQVGDRVGVGVINSCGRCDNCNDGRQQYCTGGGSVETYGDIDRYRNDEATQGGYASHIVVDEDFTLPIPDALSFQEAAPLLCAGITTYSPLKHWNAGPGKKVAVIGLGGLGHVAVKLAHAMGADVTVLSQSLRKKDDGLRLDADHYYATSDPKTFEELTGTFDLIICTVSAPLDVDAHLSLLTTEGAMVYLGVPDQPISAGVFSLLAGRRSLSGSLIGGIPETQEMLDFCAEHGIGADVEVVRADQINEAFERVLKSDVRYRFVIDISTI